MYIMSNVIYTLANGEVVRTLAEAKSSGQIFTKGYEAVCEEFEVPAERNYKRIVLD